MTLEIQLAQLRHAYAQLVAGTVRNQKQFADGLIAPAIRAVETALRRLASSDGGVKGEQINELDPPWSYVYRYHDGVLRMSGGREINGSKPMEAIGLYLAPDVKRIMEERIRSAPVTAPPADAGMRPTTEDIIECISTELSTMAESWTGGPSGLANGDDVAEYLTGTVWANLATAIDALTAPGATTKSDGGDADIPAGLQVAIDETRANMDRELSKLPKLKATSDPSSTRSDVTVESLADWLNKRGSLIAKAALSNPGRHSTIDLALALLDQFEIRRK